MLYVFCIKIIIAVPIKMTGHVSPCECKQLTIDFPCLLCQLPSAPQPWSLCQPSLVTVIYSLLQQSRTQLIIYHSTKVQSFLPQWKCRLQNSTLAENHMTIDTIDNSNGAEDDDKGNEMDGDAALTQLWELVEVDDKGQGGADRQVPPHHHLPLLGAPIPVALADVSPCRSQGAQEEEEEDKMCHLESNWMQQLWSTTAVFLILKDWIS